MLPMIENGTCRARVFRMVFTKVTSTKNEPVTTDGGIDSPFKPTNTVAAQMDAMASQVRGFPTQHVPPTRLPILLPQGTVTCANTRTTRDYYP